MNRFALTKVNRFSFLFWLLGISAVGGWAVAPARLLGQDPATQPAADTATQPSADTATQPAADAAEEPAGVKAEKLAADLRNAANRGRAEQDGSKSVDPTKPIRFSFKDAPWKQVIEWFADQAQFSLQPIEQYPEGTFTYFDGTDYTVMEALDQLNYALGLRGFTLIRNRRMLILAETEQRIPNDLIETISPDELPQRGKHELLKCVFDIRDLGESDVQRQVEDLISSNRQSDFHVIPSAGQMIVLETGQTLRTIDRVLQAARQRLSENSQVVKRYELQHTDPETVFTDAQLLLGLNGENQTPDGNFRVMVEPFSQTLLMRGTKEHVDAFLRLVETIDIPLRKSADTTADAPYLATYAVSGDLETVNKICQTMLAGRDVRFTIDASAGKAHLRGRKADHQLLEETLQMLSSGAGDFSAIPLQHISTTKAIKMLEKIYQRDTASSSDEAAAIKGPVFFPDDAAERIFVRGTPQEVQDVERYLKKIDVEIAVDPSTRSTVRVLQMDTTAVSEDLFKDLFSSLGRDPGQLRVVMPQSGSKRLLKERGRQADELDESGPAATREPPSAGDERVQPPARRPDQSRRDLPTPPFGRWGQRFAVAASELALGPGARVGMLTFPGLSVVPAAIPAHPGPAVDPQEPVTGEAADRQQDDERSVPGAPIELKVTDYGIVISGKDLDALDELETVIRNHFEESSEYTQGTVFYLKYRDPAEAKSILESLIGQSSASGGGGTDPLTGLIGGALNNAMPGLDGLLGGGGGSSGGSTEAIFAMDQPVVIYADVPMRSLVIGATERDMAIVEDLIVNYIDQPGAPQGPMVQGEFYRIPVLYRDPAELKTMIEQQLPDLIRQQSDGNGQQAQPPEAQILQQLLRRGGQRGDQQGGAKDPELQKAVLGVDTRGSALLVSGPPYIYDQILKIVETVDTKELGQSHFQILVPNQKAELLANALKPILGEKAEIVVGGAGTTPGGPANPQVANSPAGGPQNMNPQQAQDAAIRNALMQAAQQQGRGGNRGGRGGANMGGINFGGGNFGGNQGGGGNRGNRGGGGGRGGG